MVSSEVIDESPFGDAVDRLLLAEADEGGSPAGPVAMVDDVTGALTAGAVERWGADRVRRCHDSLLAERAVTARLAELGLEVVAVRPGREVFAGADLVLARLPKSLDALDETAGLVAQQADPAVRLLAGGRIKHLNRGMNDRLARHFRTVNASLGRQKCRVLRATDPAGTPVPETPTSRRHDDLNLTICAYGGTFAGSALDLGSRFLLSFLDQFPRHARRIVDLGCGSGVLAAAAAQAFPDSHVRAIDESWAAVRSAQATAAANHLHERIVVEQADGLEQVAEGSVDLVLSNPPFHLGTARDSRIAFAMIDDSARALAPSGELWLVYNSHLPYLNALRHAVGRTTIVGQNARFTVTRSVRRR